MRRPPRKSQTAVANRIIAIRGQRVLLDRDLAELYGVTTARLNQQVRRNRARFPTDFLISLSREEHKNLMLQNATSSWGGRRKPAFGFTEHGAIMAATVLNTQRAVQMTGVNCLLPTWTWRASSKTSRNLFRASTKALVSGSRRSTTPFAR